MSMKMAIAKTSLASPKRKKTLRFDNSYNSSRFIPAISQLSEEEKLNTWYKISQLSKMEEDCRQKSKKSQMNDTESSVAILKAYKSIRKSYGKNNKSPSNSSEYYLKIWCSNYNYRGLECYCNPELKEMFESIGRNHTRKILEAQRKWMDSGRISDNHLSVMLRQISEYESGIALDFAIAIAQADEYAVNRLNEGKKEENLTIKNDSISSSQRRGITMVSSWKDFKTSLKKKAVTALSA